jgi:hypothetical protein
MKSSLIHVAVLLSAGCGGAQPTHTDAPAPPTSPVYSTAPATTDAPHTLPDGTTMTGPEHNSQMKVDVRDAGAVDARDKAHDHAHGATHVMPDGAVMSGSHHGAGH